MYGRRRHDESERPLSELLRAAMLHPDPRIIDRAQELEQMERALKAAQVKPVNGGKWGSIYRSAKEALMIIFAAVSLIWFLSGAWSKHEDKVDATAAKASATEIKVDGMEDTLRRVEGKLDVTNAKIDAATKEIDTMQRADEWYRRNFRRPPEIR